MPWWAWLVLVLTAWAWGPWVGFGVAAAGMSLLFAAMVLGAVIAWPFVEIARRLRRRNP